jgi:putative Mn2+ efflux pump MntP
MNRFLKSFLVVAGLLFSVSAVAHPGHGTFTGHEVWHYLTSPMHIGIGLTVIVIAVAVYKVFKAPNKSGVRK